MVSWLNKQEFILSHNQCCERLVHELRHGSNVTQIQNRYIFFDQNSRFYQILTKKFKNLTIFMTIERIIRAKKAT